MKIKIISDGTTIGTQCFNLETGEKIGYIQNIRWEADANQPFTTANIVIAKLPIEVEGDAEIEYCDP